jgi:hypothetical protein
LQRSIIDNLDALVEEPELVLFQFIADKHLGNHVFLDHNNYFLLELLVFFDDISDPEMAKFVHLKQSISDLLNSFTQWSIVELKRSDLLPVLYFQHFKHLSDIKWV